MPTKRKDNPLFSGSSQRTFSNARELRKSMTKAEVILWERLRNRKLNGVKFRRQHPISGFIADFYSHEARLILEVDGDIHNLSEHKEHDDGRTYELEKLGITVLRFKNNEIFNNIEEVLCRISLFLNTLPIPPLLE